MISGAFEWLEWDAASDFFNQERNIYRSMVDEKLKNQKNLRTGGFVSGKTAVVDGVEYILDANGTIFNIDVGLRYVPANDLGDHQVLPERNITPVRSVLSVRTKLFGVR